MQVTIDRIFTNQITTKFGAKEKYDIYVTINGQEFKFQSWKGKWNNHWVQGTLLDLPEFNDQSRWQANQSNGTVFYTLKAPPETMSNQGGYQQQPTPQAPQQSFQPPQAPQFPPQQAQTNDIPIIPPQQSNKDEELAQKLNAITMKLDFIIEKLSGTKEEDPNDLNLEEIQI